MLLLGTHIPIYPVDRLADERPDYAVIMPWNLLAEIADQLRCVSGWSGQFVSLPRLDVF